MCIIQNANMAAGAITNTNECCSIVRRHNRFLDGIADGIGVAVQNYLNDSAVICKYI